MNKNQKTQQILDKNLVKALKDIHSELQTIKIDLKMVKVDVGLEKVAKNQSLRALTIQVEENQQETYKLTKALRKLGDDLTSDVVRLDQKIDDTAQAIQDKAKQYHNDVMTQLDFIVGRMKKFDEAHDILAYRQTNHGQRIVKLETTVFGKSSE